jgi:predicted FMN-binding regulatory protein PaiB
VEIPIARLTGKWKASQHRSTAETAKVIEALNAEGDAAAEMAAVMSATLR